MAQALPPAALALCQRRRAQLAREQVSLAPKSCTASDRFSSAREVVREGLRPLEQRDREEQAKIEWLRAAAKEGFNDIERGYYAILRFGQEIDDIIDRLGEEASTD